MLYPTYDVDQSYHQCNIILDTALRLGQYHDIALWYGDVYKPVNTPLLVLYGMNAQECRTLTATCMHARLMPVHIAWLTVYSYL